MTLCIYIKNVCIYIYIYTTKHITIDDCMVFSSSAALRMTGGTSMKRISRSIGSTCILLARMRMRMKKCLLTRPVVRAKLCLLIWASPLPTAREVQAATMIPTMKLKRTWMGMMLPAAKHPKHGSKFLGKNDVETECLLEAGKQLGVYIHDRPQQ